MQDFTTNFFKRFINFQERVWAMRVTLRIWPRSVGSSGECLMRPVRDFAQCYVNIKNFVIKEEHFSNHAETFVSKLPWNHLWIVSKLPYVNETDISAPSYWFIRDWIAFKSFSISTFGLKRKYADATISKDVSVELYVVLNISDRSNMNLKPGGRRNSKQ